jgi:hypothetical protein
VIARACYALGLLAAFIAGALIPRLHAHEADHDYVAAPIVHEHEAPDPQNRFFELVYRSASGDDESSGIPRVGIITSKNAPLAEWLSDHDGQRIAVAFRAGGPLTRDGLR